MLLLCLQAGGALELYTCYPPPRAAGGTEMWDVDSIEELEAATAGPTKHFPSSLLVLI